MRSRSDVDSSGAELPLVHSMRGWLDGACQSGSQLLASLLFRFCGRRPATTGGAVRSRGASHRMACACATQGRMMNGPPASCFPSSLLAVGYKLPGGAAGDRAGDDGRSRFTRSAGQCALRRLVYVHFVGYGDWSNLDYWSAARHYVDQYWLASSNALQILPGKFATLE